jgi:hypothetical protein
MVTWVHGVLTVIGSWGEKTHGLCGCKAGKGNKNIDHNPRAVVVSSVGIAIPAPRY